MPAWLLALALTLPAANDLEARLADLEVAGAERRLVAQRWIARHATRDGFPEIAAAVQAGGPETARRLAQALGSEDRHLDLIVLFLTDDARAVRETGEAALLEQLLRWSPSVLDPPARRRTVPSEWIEGWPRGITFNPEAGVLAEVIDRFDRLAGGPAPLVLDPSLDPSLRLFIPDREPAEEGLEGTWSQALIDLVQIHDVSFEVHGRREIGAEDAGRCRAWVRVCKRGTEGHATAAELLAAWVRSSLRELDPASNQAACRALAVSGWPAALTWMETRWLRDGDVAALEGLAAAAARGRVAPALRSPRGARALITRAEASGGMHRSRLALALGALGPIALDGTPLRGPLLEGWEQLDPTARWIRLVALEAMGAPWPEAREVCDQLFAAKAPAWLVRQALRTRVRLGGPPPPPLRAAEELLLTCADEREADDLARDLIASGARPRGDWPSCEGHGRLALGLWALGAGELDVTRQAFAGLLREGEDTNELGARLRRWAALGARAELEDLAAGPAPGVAPQGTWRRMLLLAGAVPAQGLEATLASLLAADHSDPSILLELGALAGRSGPGGERARDALVAALEQDRAGEDLLPALEIAVEGLRQARLDVLGEGFQSRLRRTAARTGHRIAGVLYAPDWPPTTAPRLPRLEDLDRRLGR